MNKYVSVEFPRLNKIIDIEENSKISDACEKVGHPLNLVCGSKGKCKKCAVDIESDGHIKTVLGCQETVFDGLKVLIEDEKVEAQILTTSILKDFKPNPSLTSMYLEKNQLKTELAENNWDTILKKLDKNLHNPPLEILQKISRIYHNDDGLTLILHNNLLIDVVAGDASNEIYGLAFDIGSTSVVGYLYNMKTYEQIGVSSRLNKQTQIGGDVISRIDHTMSNPKGLERLRSLVIDTINEITDNICTENEIDKDKIYHATFCGNSTMQHLFLGLYPEHLGMSPFTSTIHKEVSTRCSYFGININSNAQISFLPLLGGFVGADTSAVLLSLPNDDKKRLVIDLGTNGEIAVGSNFSYKVSSTACGPALEGAGLESGMRGTKGAIERFEIKDGDVEYKVIGDVNPRGICGSGIIDLISELLRCNIINKRGAIVDKSKINNAKLADRIIINNNIKSFIICYENETESGKAIIISQKDIRQVQLAKAAIFTGCNMLITECGLIGVDLDEILIAGAFGNYIDIVKAQYMGMIPSFDNVPIYSIGNAAATGCQMFLLSKEDQKECNLIAENAIHVELATNPSFSTQYMKNSYFCDNSKEDI